jgi:hypothetical protein
VALVEDEEDDAVVDEVLLESDADCIAPNKSCINWPRACAGFCVESLADVEELELVDETEELEFPLASGGGPLGGEGIESPTWLNACMTPCINVPSPESEDPLSVCCTDAFELPLPD